MYFPRIQFFIGTIDWFLGYQGIRIGTDSFRSIKCRNLQCATRKS